MTSTPPKSLPDTWAESATPLVFDSGVNTPTGRLRMPDRLDHPGLLVGWSLELERKKRPLGFGFGDPEKTPQSGYLDPILMEKDGHLITIAPTGAGKGVGCIVPALLRYEGPIIVIDPKGENVAITARRRREMGHEVIVLDPIGITDQPGASLNPLDVMDPGAATTVDEAVALASTLIEHRGDDRNRFWYDRASHLITGAILHALADYPVGQRNLPTVRKIVGGAAADPDKWIGVMSKSAHPEVRTIVQSLSAGAPETRGSIVAVAQDGVDFLRGPLVQDAMRTTSFALEDITLGKPLSIYIVLPPHMLESHGKLLRIWISTLMTAITRRRSRAKQATLFLLDEAAQLGSLSQLRQAITLLRGYGLRTWSFWQDLSQLRLLYPTDWQTMVNNCQVIQCFGSFNAMAAADVATITGFGTAESVLDLQDDEMILQLTGDQAVISRVPNYRFDPPFQGLFDPNPYFNPDQQILPKTPPRIRLYERPAPVDPRPRPEVELPFDGDEATGEHPTKDPLLERLLAGWNDR